MATYQELKHLSSDSSLLDRLTTALAKASYEIGQEQPVGSPPDAEALQSNTLRRRWAKETLLNPEQQAKRVIWLLLAQYSSLPTTQITAVTDANLQAAVDAAVDLLL